MLDEAKTVGQLKMALEAFNDDDTVSVVDPEGHAFNVSRARRYLGGHVYLISEAYMERFYPQEVDDAQPSV